MTPQPSPEDAIRDQVRARVRAARLFRGLSQQALAAPLGVSFQQVQKFETGLNRIKVEQLVVIAATLKMPVAHFLEGLDADSAAAPAPVTAAENLLLEAFRALPALSRAAMLQAIQNIADSFAQPLQVRP